MSSVLLSDSFAGVKEALTVTFSDLEEVQNNLEGEQEALPDITNFVAEGQHFVWQVRVLLLLH
jgi:hypothetical protein